MNDWGPATQLSNAAALLYSDVRTAAKLAEEVPAADLARMGDVLEQLHQSYLLALRATLTASFRALEARWGSA